MLVKDFLSKIITNFTKDEFEGFNAFLYIRIGRRPNVLLDLALKIRQDKLPMYSGNNKFNQNIFRLKQALENYLNYIESNQTPIAIGHKYVNLSGYFAKLLQFEQAFQYLLLAFLQFKNTNDKFLQAYVVRQYYHHKIMMAGMGLDALNIKEIDELDNSTLGNIYEDIKQSYEHWQLLDKLSNVLSKNLTVKTEDEINKLLSNHHKKHHFVINRRSPSVVSIVCRSLRDAKRYSDLSTYSASIWQEIINENAPTNYDVHFLLDLVRSAYQAHFRTGKFELAASFMNDYEDLLLQVSSQQAIHSFYYFRSKIMQLDWSLYCGNLQQTSLILTEIVDLYSNEKRSNIIYFLLRINAIAVYFCENNFTKALITYNELMQHYKKNILRTEGLGKEMLMYCECYRAILYYENDDEEFALYLASRFVRNYKKQENETLSSKAILTMRFLITLCKQQTVDYEKFDEQFGLLQKFVPGDKEFISLYAWFCSIKNKSNYYDELLKDISRNEQFLDGKSNRSQLSYHNEERP